jgi:hypothetical protein
MKMKMKARNTARLNNEDKIEEAEPSIAAVLRDDLNYEKTHYVYCTLQSQR